MFDVKALQDAVSRLEDRMGALQAAINQNAASTEKLHKALVSHTLELMHERQRKEGLP